MNNLLNWKKQFPISLRSPRNPFSSLRSDLERIMENADDWFGPSNLQLESNENFALFPKMDIVDDKECFKLEFEMPGMGEEDIKLSIQEGLLTVKGEKSSAKRNHDKNYLSREIHFGSYERTVSLPVDLDIENAKASFRKGMLWVEIPKRPESISKARDIKIHKA